MDTLSLSLTQTHVNFDHAYTVVTQYRRTIFHMSFVLWIGYIADVMNKLCNHCSEDESFCGDLTPGENLRGHFMDHSGSREVAQDEACETLQEYRLSPVNALCIN